MPEYIPERTRMSTSRKGDHNTGHRHQAVIRVMFEAAHRHQTVLTVLAGTYQNPLGPFARWRGGG